MQRLIRQDYALLEKRTDRADHIGHPYIPEGSIPLILASGLGHDQVVEWLLAQGADSRAQDLFGRDSLLRASIYGHGAAVSLLLRKGADLAASREESDVTPLIATSSWERRDIQLFFLPLQMVIPKSPNFTSTKEQIHELPLMMAGHSSEKHDNMIIGMHCCLR